MFEKLFELGDEVSFDDLEVGAFFVIKEQLEHKLPWQFNRYLCSSLNNFQGYSLPDIYRKNSKTRFQRLMTDYPVPEDAVNPTRMGIIVVQVKFLG